MAIAIQTCQCENSPFEMTKSPVQPMSSPIRHSPKTNAITATGVNKAETASAASCETIAADCNQFATLDVVPTTAEEVRAHAGWRIPPILMTVIPMFPAFLMHSEGQKFRASAAHTWITSWRWFWILQF